MGLSLSLSLSLLLLGLLSFRDVEELPSCFLLRLGACKLALLSLFFASLEFRKTANAKLPAAAMETDVAPLPTTPSIDDCTTARPVMIDTDSILFL